jgi:uncharacterized membrane protein YgdD (TMEM256/DUF423 family)
MHKRFLIIACWLGGVSVLLGAFGAHALKERLTPQALSTFETAVRYQFYHVFGLAITAILYQSFPDKKIRYAGNFMILGICLFCGSLYLLTMFAAKDINDYKWIGAITPIGGLSFIIGWSLLGLTVLMAKKQ